MDNTILQFDSIGNGEHYPNVRSVVQIALSDYRFSEMTDKELTEHIMTALAYAMVKQNLKVVLFENTCKLVFRKCKSDENRCHEPRKGD